MKRLVLMGEGDGDVAALPLLARRILKEKNANDALVVETSDGAIRTGNPCALVKWNRAESKPDCSKWLRFLRIAAHRSNLGGVLAVFDGDMEKFPGGSDSEFCPATAGRLMVEAASEAGAGQTFSLAVVFACVEYETWIIAGTESLAGKKFTDGRPALPAGKKFPSGLPDSHGKRWLQENLPGYRETRDQPALTELLDLGVVRSKALRSFTRLEHAIDQLVEANRKGICISTPC